MKKIYVPYLDCDGDNFGGGSSLRSKQKKNIPEIILIPNPTRNGLFKVYSALESTNIDILSLDGRLLYSNSFKGESINLSLEIPPGIYFLRYSNGIIKNRLIKFINY